MDESLARVGPVDTGSQTLKTAIQLISGSAAPMMVWWGSALTTLYNEACIPLLGSRHPQALGQSAFDLWAEQWPLIGPSVETTWQEGQATCTADLPLMVERDGHPQEGYFTFAYSRLVEADGRPGGVLCIITDHTDRVVGDRRLRTLRALGAAVAAAATEAAACDQGVEALAHNPHDLPFVLMYRVEGEVAHLVGTTGLPPETAASPGAIALTESAATSGPWPLYPTLTTRQPHLVEAVAHCGEFLPAAQPPTRALLLPLGPVSQPPTGVLIAGLSPVQALDETYRGFLELVAHYLTLAIAPLCVHSAARQRSGDIPALCHTPASPALAPQPMTSPMPWPPEQATTTRVATTPQAEQADAPTAPSPMVSAEQGNPFTRVDTPLTLAQVYQTLAEAEHARQLTQETLNAVLSSIQDAFVMLDLDWRYTYLNRKAAEDAGMPPEDCLGTCVWQVNPDLVNTPFRHEVERAVARQTPVQFEYFWPRWNRWLEYRIYPFSGGVSILSADITQRKQAEDALQRREEELRLITNAVPVLIAYVDREHRYRFVNQTYEQWFGHPSSDLYGRPICEVLGEAAYDLIKPYVEQALAGQRVSFESYVPYQDGGHRYVTATYIPQINSRGEVEGYVGLIDDVTERRHAEEALRASKERLRIALQTGKLGDWDVDLTTGKLDCSQQCRVNFGLPPETAISLQEFFACLHPADREWVRETLDQAIATQQEYGIEFRTVWPDGSPHWLSARGQAIYDPVGLPVRLVGITLDITDRKHAEDALRENAARLQMAFLVGRMGSWDWDMQANTVAWSEGHFQMLGLQPGECEPSYQAWLNAIHPDDVEATIATLHQAMHNQQEYHHEYRTVWPDGSIRWTEARGQFTYTVEGQPCRMIGVIVDITDRKQVEADLRQSEERYRYLAELIPQLVWTASADGQLLDVNQRWLDYTGLTVEQAQTRGWQAVVHPDDIPMLSERWARAQQWGTHYQAEGRMRRADGVYRWHLHQAMPQTNDQGQVIKWFGTATDIDNQKQLEQERDRILQREQAAREAAETANRIKDEFLAVLSHELRSPLNPILGWATLLQTQPMDHAKTMRALATIERNAKLQTQLIEDLLDVSRILRGKMVLTNGPVHLGPLIQAALETVQLAAAAKQIQIQTHLASNVGRVCGDVTRLQQVVWNLLSNAVKFTPPGGRIEVRLDAVAWSGPEEGEGLPTAALSSSAYAQITVADTGKGIRPEFLPYVFDYFRQEDGTTTRKFGGLGLGLAIARHLIEQHGGTVSVESPGEGQGTTFTVRLPLLHHENRGPSLDAPQLSYPPSSAATLSGLHILIVDDEADMRELMQTLLQQYGAQVSTATSASEALAVLDQAPIDLLISDIGMPEYDGYWLMQQIRRRSAAEGGTVVAIALTAYAGEGDQQRALAAGFQRHLAKPVAPDDLVKVILALKGAIATPTTP